jgi:hypothetical protein
MWIPSPFMGTVLLRALPTTRQGFAQRFVDILNVIRPRLSAASDFRREHADRSRLLLAAISY